MEYKAYVGGEFIETDDLRKITNPYDGKVVGEVHFCKKEHFEEALDYATEGFEKMKNLSVYERAGILEKMVAGLEKNQEEIGKTIALEAGKPIRFAKGEAARCIVTFKTAAEEAKRINGEIMPLDWAASAKGRTGYIRRFPIGIVSGITPFNFPLNLAAHKVAPALAAGCSIIVKPASTDPISALWLAKLAHEAGAPKGAVQVLPASSSEVGPMIEDDRVKMITFTGSPEVGWGLKDRSKKKRVALELGGNAAVIIDKDCNYDYALSRIMMGGFAYAGQVCIHTQRIIIHRSIFDKFTADLVEGVKKEVKAGDPLDPGVTLSAMIEEKEAIRVIDWIEEAKSMGAEVLTGGTRKGAMVQPVVISKVTRDMKVYKDEVFGPVIVLEPFDTFEEAIEKVNDSRFGLQAGIFTDSLEKAMTAFDRIEAGGVMINDVPTFRIDPMPYGGIKDSGFGREGLKYTIEEMTEMKLMVVNRSH